VVLRNLGSLFKSRARLEAENLILRQQLNILRRKTPGRVQLRNADRLLLVWSYLLLSSIQAAITIVKPETVIRWHDGGFRADWRWNSRARYALDLPLTVCASDRHSIFRFIAAGQY
jgi:hypothetical protein